MDYRVILSVAGLLLAAATTASGEEAYRWVDEDGVVHFSDVPREGAERVVLQRPNVTETRSAGSRRPATESERQPAEPAGPFRYESIEVVSPAAEETLWNIEGVLTVSVAVTPALQPGHQVRVYFDGEERTTTSSTSVQIDEVWRGVHNVQAEVIDDTGQLMIRSQPNRFYVQQNTILRR